MLRWTCQSCGWSTTLAAPGFAGDGRDHFPDGRTPCGPITAQRDVRYLPPKTVDNEERIPLDDDLCECGHTSHWHADDGCGDCEGSNIAAPGSFVPCECERFAKVKAA